MAARVCEMSIGYTEDFFVTFLGKIRICNDWQREDENWRRLVAVSRKKGLTFVARDNEVLTFRTADLIQAVQATDKKEVAVEAPSSVSLKVEKRVTILSVGPEEKFLVAAEDSCDVTVYRIRSTLTSAVRSRRIELEARCVSAMWINAKSFVALMENHKAVQVDVSGHVQDWIMSESLMAMDVIESTAAWVTEDEPSILYIKDVAAVDLAAVNHFCPDEDDHLIVNDVKILNQSQLMITAVSVNESGERTNIRMGIVAWLLTTRDVCVYPEAAEFYMPDKLEISDPCLSQTLCGEWIAKWDVWLAGCGEETNTPLRLIIKDDEAIEFTIPEESFVWPLPEESFDDNLMFGMGLDTSSHLRLASANGTKELRMCHTVLAASEDGMLVLSALGKEMNDVASSVCGESTESESEEEIVLPASEGIQEAKAVPAENSAATELPVSDDDQTKSTLMETEVKAPGLPDTKEIEEELSQSTSGLEKIESDHHIDTEVEESSVASEDEHEEDKGASDIEVPSEKKESQIEASLKPEKATTSVQEHVECKEEGEEHKKTTDAEVPLEKKESRIEASSEPETTATRLSEHDDTNEIQQDIVKKPEVATSTSAEKRGKQPEERDKLTANAEDVNTTSKPATTDKSQDTNIQKVIPTTELIKVHTAHDTAEIDKVQKSKERKPTAEEIEAARQMKMKLKAEREERIFKGVISRYNDDASVHLRQFNAVVRMVELTKLTKMQVIDIAMQARRAIEVMGQDEVSEEVQQRINLIRQLQESIATVRHITQCFQFSLLKSGDTEPSKLRWDAAASVDALKELKAQFLETTAPASSLDQDRARMEEHLRGLWGRQRAVPPEQNPVHTFRDFFTILNPAPIVTKVSQPSSVATSRTEKRFWKQVVGDDDWNVGTVKTDQLQLPEEEACSFALQKTDDANREYEWVPEAEIRDDAVSDTDKSFGTLEQDSDDLVLCSEEEIEEIVAAWELKEKASPSLSPEKRPRRTLPFRPKDILFSRIFSSDPSKESVSWIDQPTAPFKLPEAPPLPTKEEFLKNLGIELETTVQSSAALPTSQQPKALPAAQSAPLLGSTVQQTTSTLTTPSPPSAPTVASPTVPQQGQVSNAFRAAGFAGFGMPSQMGSFSVAPQLGSLGALQRPTAESSGVGGGFGAYARSENVFGALAHAHGGQQNAFSALAQQPQSSFGGVTPQGASFGLSGMEGNNSKLFEMRK